MRGRRNGARIPRTFSQRIKMPAHDIGLLQTGPVPPFVEEQLDRLFSVHRLHNASDRDAFMNELGPKVRALISFGAVPLHSALMQKLPKLEIVGNFGVGYDSIDAKWAGEHGI